MFCLQANEPYESSLLNPKIGDVIVLHQYLDNLKAKCFTHLVTPVDDKVVPNPYPWGTWNGRWVKVIAMTGNKAGSSIRAITTDWENMGFTGDLANLGYQKSGVYAIANGKNSSGNKLSGSELSSLQEYIWAKFEYLLK